MRAWRAARLGLVATAGFVALMAAAGVVIAAGGQALIRAFPFAGLAIGAVLVALGVWLLVTRRSFGVAAARRITLTPRRNLSNVFVFGVAYGTGSLSCTLPVFLLVVGSSLVTRGFAASLGQFLSYALGMGTILVAVTVGAALFRGGIVRFLRGAIPYVNQVSAFFLIGAGLYLIYYWV